MTAAGKPFDSKTTSQIFRRTLSASQSIFLLRNTLLGGWHLEASELALLVDSVQGPIWRSCPSCASPRVSKEGLMGAGELTTEGPRAWPALFPDHSIDPFLALAQSHSGGHIPTCSPPPPHPVPRAPYPHISYSEVLDAGSWVSLPLKNYSAKSDYANIVCSMTKLANSSGFIGGLRLKIPCPSPNPNIATKI